MRLICNSQTLCEAATSVQYAIPGKTTLPILEGILIKAENEDIYMCGYDLELGISTTIKAQILEPGEIVVNAKVFCDILRQLPGDTAEFTVAENNSITIISGEASFSLMGITSSEYPELPSVYDEKKITLPAQKLKEMIRQTNFATASVSIKPVHTGLRFEICSGKLKVVGVDGYRLAIRQEIIEGENTEDETIFVAPSKTFTELAKLCGEAPNEEIAIYLGSRHVIFDTNGYSLISRLFEYTDFMDYSAAIPKVEKTTIRVKTRILSESLRRVCLMADEKTVNPVVCTINENGKVNLKCATQLGIGSDHISVEFEGDPVEIGFRGKYMIEALNVIDNDEVYVKFAGPLSPISIVPIEGDSFIYLVLPARLR